MMVMKNGGGGIIGSLPGTCQFGLSFISSSSSWPFFPFTFCLFMPFWPCILPLILPSIPHLETGSPLLSLSHLVSSITFLTHDTTVTSMPALWQALAAGGRLEAVFLSPSPLSQYQWWWGREETGGGTAGFAEKMKRRHLSLSYFCMHVHAPASLALSIPREGGRQWGSMHTSPLKKQHAPALPASSSLLFFHFDGGCLSPIS